MIYKYIAFDLDGTLINSIPSIVESYKQTINFFYGKVKEADDEIVAKIGFPLVEFFKDYPKEDNEKLVAKFSEVNDALQKDGVPFFDGVKPVLEKLKQQGHKLYIVSSKRKDALWRWVEIMQVSDLFDIILGKHDTQKHKPDAEPLLKCMELANCKPSEILYVGDSAQDVLCAKNAGCKVAVCDWTNMDKTKLKKLAPDFWLLNMEDIFKIV